MVLITNQKTNSSVPKRIIAVCGIKKGDLSKSVMVTRAQSKIIESQTIRCIACGYIAKKHPDNNEDKHNKLHFICTNSQCKNPKDLIICSKCFKVSQELYETNSSDFFQCKDEICVHKIICNKCSDDLIVKDDDKTK